LYTKKRVLGCNAGPTPYHYYWSLVWSQTFSIRRNLCILAQNQKNNQGEYITELFTISNIFNSTIKGGSKKKHPGTKIKFFIFLKKKHPELPEFQKKGQNFRVWPCTRSKSSRSVQSFNFLFLVLRGRQTVCVDDRPCSALKNLMDEFCSAQPNPGARTWWHNFWINLDDYVNPKDTRGVFFLEIWKIIKFTRFFIFLKKTLRVVFF